jgi:regulator of replication initiation timing
MKYLLIVLLALPAITFSQGGKFSIRGTIKGIKDKTELSLKNEEQAPTTLATFKSTGEKFETSGMITEPGLYQLSIKDSQQKLMIFLDASNIVIEGDLLVLQNAKVTGSKSHDDFASFNSTFNPLFAKLSAFAQKLNSGDKDVDGTIRKSYTEVVSEVNTKTDEYINSHANSPVAPFVLLVMMQLNDDPAVMEQRLSKISEEAKMMKSENETLKSENETLKKSLDKVTEVLNKAFGKGSQAPKQKAIVNMEVIKKSEEENKANEIDLSKVTKSEISSKLTAKIRSGKLEKKDKDAITNYYNNGSIELVKHLL